MASHGSSGSARDEFIAILRTSVNEGTMAKLTLGRPASADPTLRNLFVRPVRLKAGPRFAFVWRHATRDVTKNHAAAEALSLLEPLIGAEFQDAHLFTAESTVHLECAAEGDRVRRGAPDPSAARPTGHDRSKARAIPADAPWLRALGVTDAHGRPRSGMADKFRQIQKFSEILDRAISEAPLPEGRPWTVYDMGSGKGYLTFAVADLLGERGAVVGVEARPELAEFCSRTSAAEGFGSRLRFQTGTIASTPDGGVDILIALHACDTATDDALAKGISGGAALILSAPCCQKELRPAMTAPPVLKDALRHGIFLERQAEFVTDALRAQLLEWAGYRTRVIEFVSTEHTAKNTMIAAVKGGQAGDPDLAGRIRAFAGFYGFRSQRLAAHLGFELA